MKGDKEIGEKINIIIAKLAEANDLKGVIDVADFNEEEKLGAGKEMVDRLSNLVAIFNRPELDFRKNRAEGDDILGDAYEYLMRHFATESGKSKGQFYTPSEVSKIMAKAIGISGSKRPDQTIYDPTCGSLGVNLQVVQTCTVDSGTLNFPTDTFGTAIQTAPATITVTCNAGSTAPTITIGVGSNALAGVVPRRMKLSTGAEFIPYTLTSGATAIVTNTGMPLTDNLDSTYSAQIFATTTVPESAPIGTYSDMVVMTVTYTN